MSLFMSIVAAFNVVLHRYARQDDIVIGTAASGRHYEEMLPLVGFFSNTLPLRVDLSGDPTFSELLARVRSVTLMAQAHQEVPFEKVVEVLNPERNPAHTPIFRHFVTLDVEPLAGATLAGASLEQLPVPDWNWSRFDLSFILLERGDGGLGGFVEYAADLFDAETVERMIGNLETIISAATSEPARRHLRASPADRVRAAGAGGMESDCCRLPVEAPRGAVRRAGAESARRPCSCLRGPRAQLRRAQRAVESPGRGTACTRRRQGVARRNLP